MKNDSADKLKNYTKDASTELLNSVEIKELYDEFEIQKEIIKTKDALYRDLKKQLEILNNDYNYLKEIYSTKNELEKIVNSLTIRTALQVKKIISPIIPIFKNLFNYFPHSQIFDIIFIIL